MKTKKLEDLKPATMTSIKRWIKALHSGKFKQGRGALHPERNTYCCLGVYARINGVLPKNLGSDDAAVSGMLPTRVLPQKIQTALVRLNDAVYYNNWSDTHRQNDFNDIAKYIEEKILPKYTTKAKAARKVRRKK